MHLLAVPMAACLGVSPCSCPSSGTSFLRRGTSPPLSLSSASLSISSLGPLLPPSLNANSPSFRKQQQRLRVVGSGSKDGNSGAEESAETGNREGIQDPLKPLPLFPWQANLASLLPSPSSSPPLLPFKEDGSTLRLQLSAGPSLEVPASRLLPLGGSVSPTPLLPLSQREAQGIILRAAMGTGWTTQTGLEGPSLSPHFPSPTRASASASESPSTGTHMLPLEGSRGEGTPDASRVPRRSWPELTSSPRRTSRVRFTCKRCGERTVRAINPHAYEEGTVFVQCGGCLVFHKLVDNLNLFHELQGSIFQGSDAGHRGFGVHESEDVLGLEEPLPPLPRN